MMGGSLRNIWQSRASAVIFAIAAALFLSGCQSAQSLYDKGQAFYKDKKYEDAELQFRRALQKDANFAPAHLALAETLRADNRPLEAISSYGKAFELAPEDAATQRAASEFFLDVYLNSRRKPKAIYDQLNRMSAALLRANANSAEGLLIRGALAMSENNFKQAADDLSAARQANPKNSRAALLLVEALFLDGRVAEAQSLAETLLAGDASNRGALERLYTILIQSKQIAQAGQLLERRRAAEPDDTGLALRLAAHLARQENNPAGAEAILRELADDPKRYPNGALEVGRVYLQSGAYAAAAQTFEKALGRQDPNTVSLRKLLAESYWQTGRIEEARAQIQQAKTAAPQDQSILFAEALLLLATRQAEAASRAYTLLTDLKAANYLDANLDFHRARALGMSGKVEDSVKLMQETARRQKGNLPVRFALIAQYLERQQYSDALQVVDQIDRISPENEQAWRSRLTILRRIGRLDEARNLLQQAKEVFPDRVWLFEEQGVQGLVTQRFEDALRGYEEAYKRGLRTHAVVAGLVEAHSGLKNLGAAAAILDGELKKEPNSLALRALRAELSARQGNLAAAIGEFERMVKANPKDAFALRRLASFYASGGRYPDALEAYRKIEDLGGSLPADYSRWLQAAIEARNAQEVKSVCAKLQPKFETEWQLANNCAYAMTELGLDLAEAEKIARTALGRHQAELNLRDTLGWNLYKQNRLNEALPIFESLVQGNPKVASFHYHRGATLLAMNRGPEAQEAFGEALKHRPSASLEKSIRGAQTSVR
jgi:tetratricopeptide (TPR) repeat protein